MNIQIKASFKKEFLAYFRTFKFLIIALVIIGLAIFSPFLIAGMGVLMDAMSDIYDEMGIDISGMTDFLTSSASIGVADTIATISGAGLIVMLLLLNSAAGGEQKKRTVIIPRSSGLKSMPYILPKFIIYPISAFFIAFIAVFASWGASALVFDVNDVTFNSVLFAGILTGVCLMLYTCLHITLGTATGKAGMSAAVCIVAAFLLPNFFSITGADYMYNPFAMEVFATHLIYDNAISGTVLEDIAVTIGFAFAIMIISYFVALFAQNARKIDNSGNEIEL